MKGPLASNQARLCLPGTAAHDPPSFMLPPKPLRRILTGLAAAVAGFGMSQAAPIAVSSYTYDTMQPNNWTDPGNVKLTDGVIPTVTFWSDAGDAGFYPGWPQITFDLGASHNLGSVDLSYWADTTTVFGPQNDNGDRLTISVSDDNITNTTLALGTHSNIVAVYSGDVNNNSSISSALNPAQVVNPGAPAKLAFTTQPGGGQPGAALVSQPVVTVQDAFGMTNFQKFAFGLDPTSASSLNPVTPLVGNQFTYTWYAASNLNYTVECSTDLAGWAPAITTELIGTPNASGVQIVTLTVSDAPANGKLFVWVSAE